MIQASTILSVLTVLFFCASSYFFLKSILTPVPFYNSTGYSKQALRVSRLYRIAAWGLMSGVFFTSLVISFVEVWTQL